MNSSRSTACSSRQPGRSTTPLIPRWARQSAGSWARAKAFCWDVRPMRSLLRPGPAALPTRTPASPARHCMQEAVTASANEQPTVRLSDQLEAWLESEHDKSLGGLIGAFQDKSFAILFVLLLGVPALPLPTGGATHVFEVIAA